MASAFFDPRGNRWLARFRRPHQRGKDRTTLAVPLDRLIPGREKQSADAFAAECDALARLCEGTGVSSAVIAQAAAIGAIAQSQAIELRAGMPITTKSPAGPLTVLDAARRHPSSRRESPPEARRHAGEVERFTAWAGTDRLSDLTTDRVMAYLDHLRANGGRYDGRRHALMWLRRASRMGAAEGFPDALSGLVLDRRGNERAAVQAWTFAELCALTRAATDPRLMAVVMLGGWCGMRDSEIYRAQCGDLDGDVLAIGKRKAKNPASRRTIPLPATVAAVLAGLVKGQPADVPLIRPASNRTKRTRSDGAFCDHTLPRWFARAVWGDPPRPHREPVPGKVPPGVPAVGCLPSLRRLPPKCLRKTFLSWAFRQGLPRDAAERYAGHTVSAALPVSERHYLADLAVSELRPLAAEIEARLAKIYTNPSTLA